MKQLGTAVALATLAFLYLPMLAVAVFSVNEARFGLVWQGFTWDWYAKLWQNRDIQEFTRNTIALALLSTAIATVLGTGLALAIERYPWSRRGRAALENLLYLPVVTPDLILAAALVIALSVMSFLELGFAAMVIGHVTFQIAFVALVVQSRLRGLGPDLEEAARDLYASNGYLLRRVLLPLLMPGIVAGAMLAFTLSLDDFVISFFTAGPSSTTLPIYIFTSVRRGVTPEIHALSTLIFLATVLLVLLAGRIGQRRA